MCFTVRVNLMAPLKLQMATSQWRSSARPVRGTRCIASSLNGYLTGTKVQKQEISNNPAPFALHNREDDRCPRRTHLGANIRYKPLAAEVVQLQSRLSGGLDNLSLRQAGVYTCFSRLFYCSTQQCSLRAPVPQRCLPDLVGGNFLRPSVAVRSHLFGDSLTSRHVSTSPLGAQKRYSSTEASSKVSPMCTNAPIRKTKVPWSPDNSLYLKDEYRGSDPISEMLCWIWEKKRQSKHRYWQKVELRDLLSSSVFGEYSLTIVGSSASGYGFDGSDVDMCLQFKQNFLPIDYDKAKILSTLKQRLDGERGVQRTSVIRAIVPILKFQYQRNRNSPRMQVELNVDHSVGIINTQLLYAYSRMDSRVAPFILGVKRWASNMNIKDAQYGTLSSYSLTLLMIYFLQMQGVVPVLHQMVEEFADGRGFAQDKPLILPVWGSTNKLALADLFKQMLEFYADFDFENCCVSVRDGVVISKKEAIERDPGLSQLNRNGNPTSSRDWWNCVLVQEPFNLTNTARSVFQVEKLNEIKSVLQRSLQVIDRSGGPKLLLY